MAEGKQTLKEVRKDQHLTQHDLGHLVGLEQRTISAYETGERTPDVVIARKIAQVLGVPLDAIQFGSEVKDVEGADTRA